MAPVCVPCKKRINLSEGQQTSMAFLLSGSKLISETQRTSGPLMSRLQFGHCRALKSFDAVEGADHSLMLRASQNATGS